MELPVFLKSGEVARLFPVISETGKEQRAASILLAVLSAVPSYTDAVLGKVGQKISARTTINTFTEVVFNTDDRASKQDRPDGLIQIERAGRQWNALIETKVGNNRLSSEQIERYLRLARENSINAVITISNEFAALPHHHPIDVQKSLTKKVDLLHFSWASLLTEAILLHERAVVADSEQAFLLREFIRFFSHTSAGVARYTSMPKEWSAAVDRIHAGGTVPKHELAHDVVGGWHQELRDLVLYMSRVIGRPVTIKLSRSESSDAERHLNDDIEKLCSQSLMEARLQIPNAASDIYVVADLRSRTLRISMRLDAPRDKKSGKARLNWLLRQLTKVTDRDHVSVGLIWSSRAATSIYPLEDLIENPEIADGSRPGSEIRAFDVVLTSASARRFAGRRTFIEDLEQMAPGFYESIGQHLRSWQPRPPKPKHSVIEHESQPTPSVSDPSEPKSEVPTLPPTHAGNAHSDLLEIPDYLRRSATLTARS
ncbi:MAG: hypothetical protein AAF563_23790 [Pseudomonadota bacterium]